MAHSSTPSPKRPRPDPAASRRTPARDATRPAESPAPADARPARRARPSGAPPAPAVPEAEESTADPTAQAGAEIDDLELEPEEAVAADITDVPEPAEAELAAVAKEVEVEEAELERVIEKTLHMDGVSVDDPVRLYLREIGKTALLKAPDETALAQRMEAGRQANATLQAMGIHSPVPDW